jgi:formate dehydrogenase iron-sulfur subunit
VEEIPFFARQDRLTFARVGRIDPLNLSDYEAHGGLSGLRRALGMDARRHRRGGEGERAARPRRRGLPDRHQVGDGAHRAGARKYIVCNADEGDSGTFADRMLMEGDPFTLIEGMVIAGLGVGADQGLCLPALGISRRDRGDGARRRDRARGGLLGDVMGSGRRFDMEIRVGAGAYVCGEETSLLNSLEGKRGVVRAKPPLPALEGFLGRPTVVNNVISLATVPVIFEKGAAHYAISAGPVARHDAVPDRGQREMAGSSRRPSACRSAIL